MIKTKSFILLVTISVLLLPLVTLWFSLKVRHRGKNVDLWTLTVFGFTVIRLSLFSLWIWCIWTTMQSYKVKKSLRTFTLLTIVGRSRPWIWYLLSKTLQY